MAAVLSVSDDAALPTVEVVAAVAAGQVVLTSVAGDVGQRLAAR